jgi:hypothetical protein
MHTPGKATIERIRMLLQALVALVHVATGRGRQVSPILDLRLPHP